MKRLPQAGSTPGPTPDALSKLDLHELCDRLRPGTAEAVEQCVVFFEAESLGYWHNRARAMMARRLKHCLITAGQRDRLLRAILQRLISGRFAQQFKDQLRLALQLDAAAAREVARNCERAPAAYVRRYAAWLLSRKTTSAA